MCEIARRLGVTAGRVCGERLDARPAAGDVTSHLADVPTVECRDEIKVRRRSQSNKGAPRRKKSTKKTAAQQAAEALRPSGTPARGGVLDHRSFREDAVVADSVIAPLQRAGKMAVTIIFTVLGLVGGDGRV